MKSVRHICGVTAILIVALVAAAPARADFGLSGVDAGTFNQDGTDFTQAGGHPFEATTSFELNFERDSRERIVAQGGAPKSVSVLLPPGFVGNPTAVPQCPRTLRIPTVQDIGADPMVFCPTSSIVGTVLVKIGKGGSATDWETYVSPLFNVAPSPGVAATFGFDLQSAPTFIEARVDPARGYRIVASVRNANDSLAVLGTKVILWGDPTNPIHDAARCSGFLPLPLEEFDPPICFSPPTAAHLASKAFVTNPTACTGEGVGLPTDFHFESWNPAASPFDVSFTSHRSPRFDFPTAPGHSPLPPTQWGQPQGPTGCEAVPFDPLVRAAPDSNRADSPQALAVDLALPTDGLEDFSEVAQSNLKKAVVTLPAGVSVNPSSAAGLSGCSPAQLDAETPTSPPGAGCPESAKIGSVEIQTPLLEEAVSGSVYLAKPFDNPFNSLLALYIVAKSPERGVVLKLPGKVEADAATGRLTTTFDDNPQLPFSSLHFQLKTGSRAPLISPRQCGTYQIEADLYPWARPNEAVHSSSSFQVTSGPDGGPCPAPGRFDPSFEAGTVSPLAGAFSPLVVNASRPDGSGVITRLSIDLPAGLTGKIAGVPYCSEAGIAQAQGRTRSGQGAEEIASPSCPAASQVGMVDVAAGAGPTPFHVEGKVYLAGPYKGAPISLVVITPAVAGPFDLGVVAVRAALAVDPFTAQIRAESDPIPTILHGIPLQVRSISVDADKPDFTLNPTNCEPMGIGGTLFSPTALAPVRSRFQVAACKALDFSPKLSISLNGKMRRGGNPALTAVLTQAPQQANIKAVSVVLPKTAFIDQGHISNPCTRVQFNAGKCPPKSILGTATAYTPLLGQPLSGPVYFRSNGGERELPDLVADLNGQIHITLVGFIDCVKPKGKGRSEVCPVRNRFALVPDAPVSKFILKLKGGKLGLIENSGNLCKAKGRATIKMNAQSGAVYANKPLVGTSCKKKRKRAGSSTRRSAR